MRPELPRTIKQATVWALIALIVFLGVQWRAHHAQRTRLQMRAAAIEIRRGADGQYHWPGEINGRTVDFLVDTGASGTAISTALARELHLKPLGSVSSSTAGGTVTGQLVRADIVLRGGVTVSGLRMAALPGLGHSSLLGMDVLGRLDLQQRDGVLRIERAPVR